jgi:diguanylate cyclase (GGDEF)-like protein/PAS domain S-box-containing protein
MTLTRTLGHSRHALPLLVFAAGTALSILLGVTAHSEIMRAAQQRFDAGAAELARKVEGRFDDYVAILEGIRARFNGPRVTRRDFQNYVSGLNLARKYPGFQAVNYAPYVSAPDKSAFEEAVRHDLDLEPAIATRFAIDPPGDRPGYYPLTFVEPLKGHERLLGKDLGAMPNRGDALEQSRDSGGLASSGRRIRIAGRPDDVGLAMRLPVYRPDMPRNTVEQRRAAYEGSVGAGFSVALMMGDVLNGAGKSVRLRLIDSNTSAAPIGSRIETRMLTEVPDANEQDLVLYDSTAAGPRANTPTGGAERYHRMLAFDLGGHSWRVEVDQDASEIVSRLDRLTPWLIVLGGMTLSALLGIVLHAQTTARTRAQLLAAAMTRDLHRSEQQLEEAQRLASLGSWTLDPATGRLECSDEARRLLGFKASAEVDLQTMLKAVPQDERPAVERHIAQALMSAQPTEFEHHVRLPEGSERWLHVTAHRYEEDARPLVLGAVRDDTQRRKIAQRLQLEHEIARLLLSDGEATTVIERALRAIGTHLRWSCATLWKVHEDGLARCTGAWHAEGDAALESFIRMSRTLQYQPDEGSLGSAWALGQPVRVDLAHGGEEFTRDALARQCGLCVGLVVPMTSAHSSAALELFSRDPYAADDDALDSLRVISLQLTQYEQRKQAEHDLRHLARHDPLTGLLNRAALQGELTGAIHRSKRRQRRFAVMFIDLDRFKHINDTLGHGIGDAMIKMCAERLKSRLRAGDMVARFGGDEFVLVLEDLSSVGDAAAVAQKMQACCAEPFIIEAHELHVGSSIGISVYPEDGTDTETLLKNADLAMYRAKDSGRGTYRFYDPRMYVGSSERLMLESALRRAVERHELALHYQPKMALSDGRIVGMEALLRWRHPTLGMISPAQFIPIAEETGLIEEMGKWALEEACVQTRAWQQQGLPPVQMAVNLSPRQLDNFTLVETVEAVLKRSGLPPSMLELEITESAMMKNTDHAITLMQKLRDMGVCLAMDDFGTGYSSLSYLTRFPLSTVKIDRSFINDLSHSNDAQALVDGIIKLAHSLRMKVVAEGVQTQDQLDYLTARHCDQIQGFWLCKPVPAEEAASFLARPLRTQQFAPKLVA